MLAQLASIVAPVYLIVGLGYWWVRSGRRYDTELVSELITSVGAPCLVFSSLTGVEIERAAMAEMALATLLALACFAMIGAVILRVAKLSISTFLSPLIYMNSGNMGLPLCLFAFGREGLALGVVFWATCAITLFTAGLWIWSGRVSGTELLRSPLAWSALASVAVVVSDTAVPAWVRNTTEILGDITIPLLQFTLGASLGRFALRGLPRSFGLASVRFGMGFGVGVGLAALLGLQGTARSVFVLDCTMPVAVFNYMLAERYRRSPSEVASLVLVSTLGSFATIPAILAWLL